MWCSTNDYKCTTVISIHVDKIYQTSCVYFYMYLVLMPALFSGSLLFPSEQKACEQGYPHAITPEVGVVKFQDNW